MMKLKGTDNKLTKALFKKHAKSVKGWRKQRAAMKKKFISILKNAKAALKKAGIKAQVKTLKAMDKRLAATVKRDVTAFVKEAKALDKARWAVWKKVAGPQAKAAGKAGKKMLKTIFA